MRPSPLVLIPFLFLIALTGCRTQSPLGNGRPAEWRPVMPCGEALPVFIEDSKFLLGYTLQDDKNWLPDVLAWKSRSGEPLRSGRRGETRGVTFQREHFAGLTAQWQKVLNLDLSAGDARTVRFDLRDIVVETLTDVEPFSAAVPKSVLAKPFVRTLVRADEVLIVAVRTGGVKADVSFYEKLIPSLKLPNIKYNYDPNSDAVVLGKKVYFEACKFIPADRVGAAAEGVIGQVTLELVHMKPHCCPN